MAHHDYRTPFKKAQLQIIAESDLFLAMLSRVMSEVIRMEAEAKVGAATEKHSPEQTS